MQDLKPNHMTFNILTCVFECIPETCNNDTYYWDSEECMCMCYPQECRMSYHWDEDKCACHCDGIPLITKIVGGVEIQV